MSGGGGGGGGGGSLTHSVSLWRQPPEIEGRERQRLYLATSGAVLFYYFFLLYILYLIKNRLMMSWERVLVLSVLLRAVGSRSVLSWRWWWRNEMKPSDLS